MIGVFSYTVILTYLGLASGVTGIYFCANNNPIAGAICLLIAGAFDLFDGTVARIKKNRSDLEKGFGIQIDSLADMVCFGILPAMLGYASGMQGHWYFAIPMAIYAIAALVRLAYYNVTEEERQKTTDGHRTCYIGLPVTNSMFIFALLFAFSNLFPADHFAFSIVYAVCLLIVAFLFVSKLSIPKPHGKIAMAVMFLLGAAIFTFIIINCVVGIGSKSLIEFWL